MRHPKSLAVVLGLSAVLATAGTAVAGQPQKHSDDHHAAKPTKVVMIVVDALSREIVDKYHMDNIKGLMAQGVNSPNAYLGHLGSVTVVTHNVLTSGLLPKHMGWSDDGWKDTNGILGGTNPYWIPSDWGRTEMNTVQATTGVRRLPDYLHAADPNEKVFTISPKTYAAWAYGGPTSDSVITFGSNTSCPDGNGGTITRRGPAGVNVPAYISDVCGRYYVARSSSLTYDTNQLPASLYPLDGNRYTVGHEDDHQGGDIWATDIALDVMKHEAWSGIFLTLPDVDKSAHMWGSVDDPGCVGVVNCDPMTHLAYAAKTADEQVGRVMQALKDSGELDNTIVVLTADHGSVPGRDFEGVADPALNYGYNNWYYGSAANDVPYLKPQPALQALVDTGNVAFSYSDSLLRAWLKDTSADKTREASKIMYNMPGVSAVWVRHGDHYDRSSPVAWNRMPSPGERRWFVQHAHELVNTEAAAYGPDIIATLVDDTTYSVKGDHGGIQRRSQQIPIVFAGAGLSSRDLMAPIRSVDIMPTVLRAMGIKADAALDGYGYQLPTRRR